MGRYLADRRADKAPPRDDSKLGSPLADSSRDPFPFLNSSV